MAISLKDVQDASRNYAIQHLEVVIAPLEAIPPWLPRRGEEFLFEIYVHNTSAKQGGIPIVDVRVIPDCNAREVICAGVAWHPRGQERALNLAELP